MHRLRKFTVEQCARLNATSPADATIEAGFPVRRDRLLVSMACGDDPSEKTASVICFQRGSAAAA